MYRELNKKEIQEFIYKYLPEWENDIWKVSCISYNKEEYLINEHYIYIV